MNANKRILATLLVISMVVGITPVQPILAADDEGYAVCSMEEHTHTENCYTVQGWEERATPSEAQILMCTLPEHIHTEECHAVQDIPSDKEEGTVATAANTEAISDDSTDQTEETENEDSEIATPSNAAISKDELQAMIDALPDVSAGNFALTDENHDELLAKLEAVAAALEEFENEGGNVSELDLTKFNNLQTVLLGGLLYSAGSDAWAEAIVEHTSIEDLNFAKAIAESMEEYGGYTDAHFTSAHVEDTLRNYPGEINAENRGITNITGVGLLLNITGDLNLQSNQITDVQPLSGVEFENPDFRRVMFRNNPISNYPSIGYITPGFQNCDGDWGAQWTGSASYLYGTVATQNIPYRKTTDYDYLWETAPRILPSAAFNGQPSSFANNRDKAILTVQNGQNYRVAAVTKAMGNKKDSGNTDDIQTYSVYYMMNNLYFAPVSQSVIAKVVGGIKFIKVNGNGEPLQGAVYRLLDNGGNPATDGDGNPVENQTTDANGVAKWSNLTPGTYQIQEVTAPDGYTVDATSVTVTVTDVSFETALEGGHKSIETNQTEETFTPDDRGFMGIRGALVAEHPTISQNAGAESTYIRNGGSPITTLIGEVIPQDADKVMVKEAGLTLSMNGTSTQPNSLDEAKSAINARITGKELNERDTNITLTGSVVYQMTEENYNTPAGTVTTPDGTVLIGVIEDKPQPVYVPLSAVKNFEGGTLSGNDFTFELNGTDDANGLVEQTKKNAADGVVTFDALKFDGEGIYTYTLSETEGGDPVISYDTTTRVVEITVSQAAEAAGGGLKAVVKVDGVVMGTLYSSGTTQTDGTMKADLTAIELTTFANSKKPVLTKTSDRDDQNLHAGDSITYTLTASNPLNSAAMVTIADNLPDKVELVSWTLNGAEQNGMWSGSWTGQIPAASLDIPGQVVIVLHCKVRDDVMYNPGTTDAERGENVITNQASMTYNNVTTKTDFHTSYVAPKVSYTMNKRRVTAADAFGVGTGQYGFLPGTSGVEYEIAVENTGDLPLTLHVDDEFTTGSDNFTNVQITAIEVQGGGTTAAGGTDADVVSSFFGGTSPVDAAVGVDMRILPGKTALLTVTADIEAYAPGRLDDTEQDNESNNITQHGYKNTASATGAYSDEWIPITVTYDDDGNIDGIIPGAPERFSSQDEGTTIPDQSDTAWTPVQPTMGYTIQKERISQAPAKENTNPTKYGFYHGDTVTYTVIIENTGSLPLTMTVDDSYGQSTYFDDITYTAVNGASWNNNAAGTATAVQPQITIAAGATATVTITARVTELAAENLSEQPSDNGMGYRNTAVASGVTAAYDRAVTTGYDSTATVNNVNFETELADNQDTANTPVQVAVISISGTKVWDDENNRDGKRPSNITVNLLRDGAPYQSTTVTPDADGNWNFTFTDLPKYKNGNTILYTYTVDETAVDGYTKSVNGTTITNSYTPETLTISGSKVWDDDNNRDGRRPEGITVRLLADGIEIAHTVVTPDMNGNWNYSFTNLPKYRDQGTEIQYNVTEDAVTDYSTVKNGNNFINSYTPGRTSVTVTKVWDDRNDQDGRRPSALTVMLYANGTSTGKTLTLSESNNWTDSFTNLYTHENGAPIVYTVQEETVADYTGTIAGSAATGFVLTNSYTPEKISIPVTKRWDDENNRPGRRPESITIHLLADGVEIQSATVMDDGGGNWGHIFTDLDKYKNGGTPIVYTVTEDKVPDYRTTYPQPFEIVNSLVSIWAQNTTGNTPLTQEMEPGKGGTIRVTNGDDSNDTANGSINTGDHDAGRDYGCTIVTGTPKPGWYAVKQDITISQKNGNTPGEPLTIVDLPTYNYKDGTFSFVTTDGVTVYGKLTIDDHRVVTVEITNPEGLPTNIDVGIPFIRTNNNSSGGGGGSHTGGGGSTSSSGTVITPNPEPPSTPTSPVEPVNPENPDALTTPIEAVESGSPSTPTGLAASAASEIPDALPKTRDNGNRDLWLFMMDFSLMGIGASLFFKRKRRNIGTMS